jgi:DNA-binding ferritin-like protein
MELPKKILQRQTPNDFFSKLMEILSYTKVAHMTATNKSYSEHMALGSLYEGLDEKIDKLTETYAGKYSTPNFTFSLYKSNSPVDYLKKSVEYIESNQNIFKETFLLNQVDEIVSDLYHCIYKLDYLK